MRALASLPVALMLCCALAASPAGAAARRGSALSPRLAELARPATRNAPPGEQAARLGLPPRGPGSLQREGGRVLVDVSFDHGAAAMVGELRERGAEIVHVSRRYQTATVAAKPSGLNRLASADFVDGVTESLEPITFAASACPAGLNVSEGDEQLLAAEARSAFGVDGSGVTVGILSDSFDQDGTAATDAAEDVASGDLPGAANPCGQTAATEVLDDSEKEGADEGRAMAQIVHDLAPGAGLAFASAFTGETAFAANIERLAEPVASGGGGAGVIADDVAYFDEPFFQDGPVAVAIEKVTGEGVSHFSAAGNDNILVGGRNIGSWQGQFDSNGGCPEGTPHYSAPDQYECTDFDGGGDTGFGITVAGKGSLLVDLQWAEPWYGVATDIDAYLLDSSNKVVAKGEYNNPGSTKKPFEILSWDNSSSSSRTVRLVIKRYSGSASPLLKFAMLENGAKDVLGTEYEESTGSTVVGPTIFGHSGSEAAVSVAAVPYSNDSSPEYYSSRGPVEHYFGSVSGTSAAPALLTPVTLAKPDLAATDCGQTTFFAFQSGGLWRFCGTSAAAPHAAAVAALMREADPALTPVQVRDALTATGRSVGAFPAEAVGAGLIDAGAALAEVAEPIAEPEEEGGEEPSEEAEAESEEPEGEPEENPEGEGAEEVEEEAPAGEEPDEWTLIEEEVTVPPPIPVAEVTTTANPFVATSTPKAAARSPRTWFRQRPRRTVHTRRRREKIVFVFASNAADASYFCRVDRHRFRRCPARLVRRFGPGSHTVRAVAFDAAGHRDPTPAVWRFRVRRLGRR